ncbi:site-specific integrase [Granulosicoccus sp.]|nr:site-specific integrase [Granulosicoccus sp.]
MKTPTIGSLLHAYFENYLIAQKGLSAASIKSYRDSLRLFLHFLSKRLRRQITRLKLEDLTAQNVIEFLNDLEKERHNHIRSRNQRLSAIRCFFKYAATQIPEMLMQAEKVTLIPAKRVPPPRTQFMERDEIESVFKNMPTTGAMALRDRALLLFLYNTGARAQEVADLRISNLELPIQRVRLHGKGNKWRTCPLWDETIELLNGLIDCQYSGEDEKPVFTSQRGQALTRFGIYKIVRKHTDILQNNSKASVRAPISPHCFRHTIAMHLLESEVDVNVIRAWLGHVSLETTDRYAEINIGMKEQALQKCDLTPHGEKDRTKVIWRNDPSLLDWLQAL